MATDDKYDRQLRLWGSHGQKALMEAKVCVLGASACATETVKNLVLPGIGHVTIVDSARVVAADLGHNFFLEEGDVGKPRAEAVLRLLLEMNPDVQGEASQKDPVATIETEPDFFRAFTLVVACQLSERVVIRLCEICRGLGIPAVFMSSVGFLGKLRLYAPEHAVCETKPDGDSHDLRLTDPFPELRRFADAIAIDDLDDAQHAHVPYVVILLQALDRFRRNVGDGTGTRLPATREEKDALKQIVASMQRSPQEANFSEALDNAYKAWVPYSIPDAAQTVLGLETSCPTSDFWIVAKAVAQFVQACGKLPLAGSLPDMTASTDLYVRLQEIYGSRAEGDLAAIQAHVATVREDLGVSRPIDLEFVKRFCQNAQTCEVFRFRTLQQELAPSCPEDACGEDLGCECCDEDSQVQWYLALRASDAFREEHGHAPGARCGDDDEVALAADLAALSGICGRVCERYGSEDVAVEPKKLEELVRCGGCELHTTSSVLGAAAAQEVVKLVAKQYSPLNNTLIYNGLEGKAQVIEL